MLEPISTSISSIPNDFDGWWNAPGTWVEEPNQRRSGWSGMITSRFADALFYIKRQNNHLYRSLQHPFGMPTTSREYANLLLLASLGIKVPEPVFHGWRKTPDGFAGILVTRELTGFRAISEAADFSAERKKSLASATGKTLGKMHRKYLQHSCLYPQHIMFRWQDETPEIALIDLEKLHRAYLPWRAAGHDLDQLYRHQKLWNQEAWDDLLKAHAATSGT